MDIVELMREIHYLTGESKGSVYESAIEKAEAKAAMELEREKLKSILAAIKDGFMTDLPASKAEPKALSDSRYKKALLSSQEKNRDYYLKEVVWAKRLNRLEGVKALLIAEQSLAKNLK